MTNPKFTIGVVGLGLIGGSIALSLSLNNAVKKVVALDKSEKTISYALNNKIISEGTVSNYSIFKDCDAVFICTPVNSIINAVNETAKHCKGIITDTASLKSGIVGSVDKNVRFIGGHPMAGSERTGIMGSESNLFENAVYVICSSGNINKSDIDFLKKLIGFMRAIPFEMDCDEHDKTVAAISHLPHVISAALINSTIALDNSEKEAILAAGGFKDITRISSSDPVLWSEISLSSKRNLIPLIDTYIGELNNVKKLINNNDFNELKDFFGKAKENRDNLTRYSSGKLKSNYEIWVDVKDKPGIIGSVATLLGNNGINISNIGIENNREYEGGCLRITVASLHSAENAVKLFEKEGYSCKIK